MFDRSVSDTEQLHNYPHPASPCHFWLFAATILLFGIFLVDGGPTGMRLHVAAGDPLERTMTPSCDLPPLALRPREAAQALGISERTLWEYTRRGLIPAVRVGGGRRQTVLYPVAVLREWLARQAAAPEGGEA